MGRAGARAGPRVLGLTPAHGLSVAALPLHHRDPFDRLLIAPASSEDLTLVTADERIAAYDVPTLDPLTCPPGGGVSGLET